MDKLIKRRVLISMLFIGLSLMGFFSYRYLNMELYPNAERPELSVVITGITELDPTYIENQAAIPIEGVISTLEGVEEIETRISTRNARISVTFSKNVDIKYAYLKLEEKVKAISQNIPEEFRVTVNKSSTGMVSSQFMSLFVLSPEDVDYVRNITDLEIAPVLENVEGIAGVNVIGGRQKSIEIIVDEEKCEALNITRSQISALISRNMTEKTFAGTVYDNNKRFFVNITAEYLETEDIGNIVVASGPVLLKDIAEISFGIKEEESYSRINGKEVITCILSKSPQVNVIDLSNRVRKEIENLNRELEVRDVEIKVSMDVAETMSDNIDTIVNLGLTGAVLAIFILYLFLRNLKIVTIIAFAIPISVFSSFYFFYLAGISINTLTLTGIALAVGMLLDNSVVVMENIFRLRAIGVPADEAAVKGTKEVWKSVFAATLTTIIVFLPFVFSENYMLKLIGQHIGVSIISTLLISLVVALLLIPMAINYFMSKDKRNVNFSVLSPYSRPVQMYIAILKMSLRKPVLVVISSIIILAITVILSLTLTLNTLKEIETDSFDLYITSPSGFTLERTDDMIRRYEEALMEVEEIEEITANIYATDARITVNLKENFEKINHRKVTDLKSVVLNMARGLRIWDISLEAKSSSENFQGGGGSALMGGGEDLLRLLGVGTQSERIVIKGQDYEAMENLAEYIQYQLQDNENISYASVNYTRGTPEARIQFDQYLMGIYDVTPNNVVTELNNFAPENTTQVKYKTDEEEYDIIIKDKKYAEAEDEDKKPVRSLEDLRNMDVSNANNSLVDLRSFSQINLTRGKGSIVRKNQEKEVIVTYRFNSDVNESKNFLTTARTEIDDIVQAVDIPAGLAVEVIHEEDETDEFTFLILAAFLIIYMILASVFESLSAPIVLMFAIPLAAIGSLLALLFTSNSLMNANVLMGFIILIGIVVNNSIILIDYTTILRRQGNRKPRAIIIAGVSRLRPILITAITTIVAMFPLALGKGEFVSGLGAPFAITVIGGLTMSTILTLVIIPTLYSGLEDALNRLRTQRLGLKILQLTLLIATVVVTALFVDSIWWKLGYLILAVLLIPGVTWFMESSLRQANTRVVPAQEEIIIQIRNLVKIYGRASDFTREWKSGIFVRKRLGIKEEYHTWKDLRILLWFIPVLGFMYYFTYIYQSLVFWGVFFSIFTWLLTLKFLDILGQFLAYNNKRLAVKIIRLLSFATYYFMPLITLIWATAKFREGGIPILIGLLWYMGILVKKLGERLDERNINIDKIDGRFRRIRKGFYRLATKIPVIGYKKKPFKALNAVSMDIRTGMFGLLGPNGAGKTTLMRIICGVFEQSYGKIFINGVDTQEKREELQGLIGYLPQEFGTYENLTSYQYLEYQALLKGLYDKKLRQKRIKEVLEAVHMYETKDKKIGGFSGGMKQRIGIAQTLLNLPRILVVDEPTAGLDPRERIRFRNLLVELSRNRIVIFSTHIIEDIASSCNQVGVINKGSLKYYGTPSDMANIAKNVAWVFEVPVDEFEKLPADLLIVHHIRLGDNIKVRCLSETQPTPNAIKTNPVLEDSYLWLLRGVKIANNEEIITQ
ncbi:MAG: efflux RND transporter permease subunit [Odoribacter sp.]|nr:efflux RND transporter permease subunit [Odoribacter sp.]